MQLTEGEWVKFCGLFQYGDAACSDHETTFDIEGLGTWKLVPIQDNSISGRIPFVLSGMDLCFQLNQLALELCESNPTLGINLAEADSKNWGSKEVTAV